MNKWGRRPTPQDRYCCAGCDKFMFVDAEGYHLFFDGSRLFPCQAKEVYGPDDPSYPPEEKDLVF